MGDGGVKAGEELIWGIWEETSELDQESPKRNSEAPCAGMGPRTGEWEESARNLDASVSLCSDLARRLPWEPRGPSRSDEIEETLGAAGPREAERREGLGRSQTGAGPRLGRVLK